MNCQKCKSSKVVAITAKCGDLCVMTRIDTVECKEGEVPSGIGIGGGDYLKICVCFDCGQLQGKFPVEDEKLNAVFGKVDDIAIKKLLDDMSVELKKDDDDGIEKLLKDSIKALKDSIKA